MAVKVDETVGGSTASYSEADITILEGLEAVRKRPGMYIGSTGPSGLHHLVCAKTPLVPTLLLDDVFSELDPGRSRALVAELPAGQALLTTAAPQPGGIDVARVLAVETLERS